MTASGSCTTGSTGLASITLDFGDGTPPTTTSEGGKPSDTFSGSHAYQQSGPFTITVTATDVSTVSGGASQSVTVNDPPVCTFSVDKNSGPAPLTVQGTANCTDTENDLTSATIFWGDGLSDPLTCSLGSCQPSTVSHTYNGPNRYTASVQANDSGGKFGSKSQSIVAQAPNPTCALVLDKTSGTAPLTVSARGSNCTANGGSDMATASISWGDGSPDSSLNCDGSCSPFTGSHTYNLDGTYTVTLTGQDFTGPVGSDSKTVTVGQITPPQAGDVYASDNLNGTVLRYSSSGTLLQTLDTGVRNGDLEGVAFDRGNQLYAADDSNEDVFQFDSSGALLGTFGSFAVPNSLVFDRIGNAYVIQLDNNLVKVDSTGSQLASYAVASENGNSTDFLDLAADQCTVYYTSEGSTVKRFDVCANSQLADFAVGPASGLTDAEGLRILPNGDVLVADGFNGQIVRFNAAGQNIQTYSTPNISAAWDVALDPDKTSFWAGDFDNGQIAKFDIATGNVLVSFQGPSSGVGGLAIRGATTAGTGPSCTLVLDKNSGAAPLTVDATGSSCGPGAGSFSTLASIDWGDDSSSPLSCDVSCSFQGGHTYTNAGTFSVVLSATDGNGSSVSVSQTVTVTSPPPTCSLTVTPRSGLPNLPVDASGSCASPTLSTVTLSWGDGSQVANEGTSFFDQHTYTQVGVFVVTVTGTDAQGQTGSASQTVTILAPDPPQDGNVYISVADVGEGFNSNGLVESHNSADGDLVQILATNTRDVLVGLAFDRQRNLYVTDNTSGKVFKFGTTGALLGTFGSGNQKATSILFDATGNAYVGLATATNSINKFNVLGTPIDTYPVALENPGSFVHIALAVDQCTMYYTSMGATIKRYDVCTKTQLTDFVTGLSTGAAAGLRIRPNGEVLLADRNSVLRFNAAGQQLSSYVDSPNVCWTDVSLDSNGTSFWASDECNGDFVSRFDIATGNVTLRFHPSTSTGALGIAVRGEITAALVPPPTCTLLLNPTSGQAPLTVDASGSSCVQPRTSINTSSINWGDGTSDNLSCDGDCFFQGGHTYTIPAIYTVTLTATDNNGQTASVSKTVTVSAPPPPPNQPPACTLGVTPASGTAPLSVTATGACTDPDNNISSTSLDFGDGTVAQGSTSGTHTYATAGTFTVTVSANDSGGLSGSKSQSVVVAAPINQPPSCTLTVTPSSGIAPLSVTANGSCTDPENGITKTTLDFGDGTVLQASSGTHIYAVAGNFTVVLTATDSGQLSGSASQAVSVSASVALVYVATSGGNVIAYTPDGKPSKTLTTGFAGSLTGMAFDPAGAFYVTGFTAAKIAKFDASGNSQGTFGGGFNCRPESMVFDVAGNAYVGQAGCSHDIVKLDPAGTPITNFQVDTEDEGSDWIDMSSDQCTLFYTSEGHKVFRYDVCRGQQLPVFTDQLHKGLAMRLLSDGGLLVADNIDIHRLDASGKILSTYDAPGEDCWVGLTLDPDGSSFWAADACTANVYKFSISSGTQLFKLNTGTGPNTIFGLGMNAKVFQAAPQGTMSASPATSTVKAGQPATYSITIDPSPQTSGKTFTLTCTNLPAGASCSFAPPSVTVGSGNTTTLTINTTPSTVGALQPSSPASSRWGMAMMALLSLPIVGFMLLSRSATKRNKTAYLALFLISLLLISGSWMLGCGGGGQSSTTTKTFSQASTPAGKFTVLVVGVSGSTQTTTPVTLNVN